MIPGCCRDLCWPLLKHIAGDGTGIHQGVGLISSLSGVMAEMLQKVLENVAPEGQLLPQAEGILP